MPRFTPFVCVILALMLAMPTLAQHVPSKERVDPTLRRQTDIDGNNIRATIFNSGLTGRTGSVPNAVPYEWPKNSSCTYIALTGMFYGALVEDINGEEQKIVDIVQFRSSPSGESWSHEPIPGYNNPDYRNAIQTLGIAKSTDPESWPQDGWADKFGDETDPGWVGAWNGFFGKDIFNADQELFFKMGDDNYDRWLATFQPDATDPSRGGLALVTEMRVMAWSQILVNDVIYLIHNIQNDGTTDYERMAFTIWLADLVGGDGDAQDDLIGFSLINDIAFFRDSDGIGCGGRQIGAGGVSFLETPGIAIDRIDNDGDGEVGPVITEELLAGEDQTNLIDDNGNGLIDENSTHIPFIGQSGVGYADRIDNDGDAEPGSPVISEEMVNAAVGDPWHRWPPDPEADALQDGQIHLIMVENDDVLSAFADNIDNDGDGEDSSSVITQEIVDAAAGDPYKRYRVPGTSIILYDVGPEDLGMAYADGIDNDGDNAIDEGIDTGIDEMIEESRENHIDDDGDWDIFNDDVGLDGVANTGDIGENDGVPTSGAGTPFPGEPNLDKTDISESDQLGITNVQWEPAGSIDFNVRPDLFFWNAFMVPGQFVLPTAIPGSDRDLFVSSGLFPLNSGSIGRISYAVIMGEDTLDVLLNRERAQETYNADYQFAKAPLVPTLSAVAGDNQVTLYWDDVAEESFDTFMDKLGQPAKDFEGYRLYRAQDPAFEDIFTITDGNGTRTFLEPIQQWDLVDEWTGFHPIDVNGIKFKLGDNTGIVHSYVDRDVTNGKTYYYALTSFDFGNPGFNISPSESPILITIDAVGKADLGKNVLEIVPAAPVAGYRPPEIGDVNHVSGGATGELRFYGG